MAAEPIRYYNRYTKTLETEDIYGEGWLRFTYGNPIGAFFLWFLVKRALFSHAYGWQMNKRVSGTKVLPFIVKYNLNTDEFAKSPFDFRTFNEFFYRGLKKTARPIAEGERVIVFPADGRHLVFPNIEAADGFYVKGQTLSLEELLGEASLPADQRVLSREFAGGGMVISRLCPVDYHRFHFPCAGVPTEPKLIPGPLFSVSPIALRRRLNYLMENKRMITVLDTPMCGRVICMEVGATNVGSISQTFVPNRAVAKGEEKGLFKFGGSCVITLFPRGKIKFDADLIEQSRQHIETYARMGDRLGAV